jgi:hypothetical protein
VGRRVHLGKKTGYETHFWCAGGIGIVREEFWVNARGAVVRYNLAFLLPHLYKVDNGRVLAFDNAHGTHERHYTGEREAGSFRRVCGDRKTLL